MTLLLVAGVVGGFGSLVFAAGFFLGRPGLAMLGAILVIGIGGAGMVDGYQVKTGQEQWTEVREEPAGAKPIGQAEFSDETTTELSDPTGVLAFGDEWSNVYALDGDDATRAVQFRRFDFNRNSVTERHQLDFTQDFGSPTMNGLWLARAAGQAAAEDPDRTKLYTLDTNNENIVQYDLAEPGNLSTATLNETFNYGGLLTQFDNPQKIYVGPKGLQMYVFDYGDNNLIHLSMDSSHDMSTLTIDQEEDVSSEVAGDWDVAVTSDGLRLFLFNAQTDEAVGYQMSEPFNFSTRSQTGSTLTLESSNPDGAWVYDNDTRMIVSQDTDANFDEYKIEGVEQKRYNVTSDTYTDVSVHSELPLGAIIMLLGVLMLMGSAGEASETRLRIGGN